MAKSDPINDPEYKSTGDVATRIMERMVRMPPKQHKDAPKPTTAQAEAQRRRRENERQERPASSGWLVAPLKNGCMCLNLGDAETVFVEILQVPESRVKDYLDAFNGGANYLRVFHFPVGGDISIFEAVNRFIAKRFEGGSRVLAAFYGKGIQREFQRQFEAADARDKILGGGRWHTVTPISGACASAGSASPSA